MAQNENISLSLANKVDILNKTQSVDARYGVYDTEQDALDAMALYGLDGRQVAVYTDKPNGKIQLFLYNETLHQLEPISGVFDPLDYDLSEFTNTSINPFVQQDELDDYIPLTQKGAVDGVVPLNSSQKIDSLYLPSYVDDVEEYADLATFPATGESGKIYIALDTNFTYRWSGSAYVRVNEGVVLGETSTTAYRGDRGKTAYDHSQGVGNPHQTTLQDVINENGIVGDKAVRFMSVTPDSSRVDIDNEEIKVENVTDGESTKIGVQDIEFEQGGNKLTIQPKEIDDDYDVLVQAKNHTLAGLDDIITDAVDIDYDNTSSGLTATDVQEAIDEVQENIENYIPLTGTEVGKPITGSLKLYSEAYEDSFEIWFGDNLEILSPDNGGYLELSVDSIYIGHNTVPVENFNGIIGLEYYGQTYTDNTYVQKKYVDDAIDSIPAPAIPDAEDIGYNNTTSGLDAENAQDAIDEVQANIDEIVGNTVFYKSISSAVTEPTLSELNAFGTDRVDFPNLDRIYFKNGAKWTYVETTDVL